MLQQLTDDIIVLQDTISELEDQVKTAKKELDQKKFQLFELMEAEGLTDFTEDSGKKVRIKVEAFISCKVEDHERLRQFLGSDAPAVFSEKASKINSWGRAKLKEGEQLPDFLNVFYKEGVVVK